MSGAATARPAVLTPAKIPQAAEKHALAAEWGEFEEPVWHSEQLSTRLTEGAAVGAGLAECMDSAMTGGAVRTPASARVAISIWAINCRMGSNICFVFAVRNALAEL